MKRWEESEDDINKVRPDKEMAKSLLKLMEIRAEAHRNMDREKFSSIIVEAYYEIIKEGITALMAIDGYKTLSHEVLVGYLLKFHKEFPMAEISLIDQMRQLRNKIVYKGQPVNPDYLNRNEAQIKEIIEKLKAIIKRKL